MSVSSGGGSTTQLRRGTLGVAMIVFFVISAASPLSVLAGGFPIGLMLGNGAGLPALVIVALAVLLCFAAGYTGMARHVTHAGGFYAFISRGLGGMAGGAAGVLAMVAYNILQAGMYGLFGAVFAGTLEAGSGILVPWWLGSLLALLGIAWLGYRNIDLSARVLSIMVIAEYAVVVVLDVAIFSQGGLHGLNLESFTPTQIGSGNPSIGLLFCFAAFIGFEASTLYGEEARDPQRTIPRATYISVLLIGGFYTISVWAMVLGAGTDEVVARLQATQDPTTFLYALSDQYVGAWLTTAIRLLFVVSLFAGLLAFHNAAARYFFAIGRDGLLPERLGNTHRVHQSPHIGSLVQSLVAATILCIFALIGADPVLQLFSWFSNLATLCLILLMALTSLAVIGFFKARPQLVSSALRCFILPAVSGVALLAIGLTAVVHFDVLTGASTSISVVLWSVIPLSVVIGLLLAARLRSQAPLRFSALGNQSA
ncbi:APC family permease [Pseudomonas sp. DTU_2021_1001937_2_SI_NGA_ILE_001]|uniref:APC family permease n=1 Tax=Pseudomonas sp. DTU_2021_1001937_2_SI_NGA_ILE_001 TaxID=3077589 RepID=UPI0028FC2937|nr:APC family permease [Pseudomonas sp. DTU_2021_1001937_2_SI_NGA_ILE_001]WNW09877.1 APC family permease [Pseudomonas sp. DTU_2021_1001937_2_SI_NGA_ILE_001]